MTNMQGQGFDEVFFKEVFDTYFDKIFSAFRRKVTDTNVAQDLTQLTFLKFWEYRSTYTFELSTEIQLFRKAKLVFIDWLRKEAHQRKIMDEMKQISEKMHSTKFELTDTLKIAIEQLPAMRKKVFSLAYIDGYSHKEIADQLNISTKTVDAHVLKALNQLRKLLAFYVIITYISQLS
ncbi:RNA polymerase sigma factor [Haoranjiania flava]|uniref:Sigma-70 family RNA polymerase sigma factor n=1 Tax=Haoranjiania flava TaxID=1856322 RepID=A0AAE3LLT9_9BACT|nr:sigma-70 family RNA polymerase sigma factor [Haoranjiania flava]MCU7693056.1 sigma-70 family RNA polymerase sigma factor [Haoranjiania flava]